MSPTLSDLTRMRDRLVEDEPIRILIGHRFHDAAEIVPGPRFAGRIRAAVLSDILAQIDALTGSTPPAAPAVALPSSAASGEAATSEGQT